MPILISIDSIKSRYPTISIPDETLRDVIDLVNATVVPCLEASYQDVVGLVIANNMVAHLAELSAGRRIKSQTAVNGASQSFDLGPSGGDLSETSYGRMVRQLDTHGCTEALYPPKIAIFSCGGRNRPGGCR